MCGIVGVFDYGGPGGLDAGLLARMRDTMTHRGPDDADVYVSADGRLGLGHRRLAILDVSPAGRQPMASPDSRYRAVYNGEVYNFRELRAELEARGHPFRSRSDTEVLLALYAEEGAKMLHRLRGMFALAIWDETTRRLWLARDRIGVKPLYYAVHGGRFLFASEIKALLAFPGLPRTVDVPSLYHYLSFLTTPAPATLFAGIHKLPPGHTLTMEADGTRREDEYWDVFDHVTPIRPSAAAEVPERLLALLRDAVRYRMVSDVPFGVFLSGGLDSSTNVALMAELLDRPVETFSIGFDGAEGYNEFAYARQVAARFGARHHEVRIGVRDLIGFLPTLVHHQDEPIADPVCVPVYFVARLAKDHGVTVCQVGEGSDELFCGYPRWRRVLRAMAWTRRLGWLPAPVRRLPAATLAALGQDGAPIGEAARRVAAGQSLFWGGAEAFFESEKRRLLRRGVLDRVGSLSSYAVVAAYLQRFRERSPFPDDDLAWMAYLDLRLRLPELLLMRVDKMTMATAVEARVPFLDHELVSFAMGVPQALKVAGGELKHLLKRAVADLLPAAIVHRPKQGFQVPVTEWLLTELGPVVRDVLTAFAAEQPYFEPAAIERLLASGHGAKTWYLLNFALWHRHWIEARPMPARIEAAAAGRP
ncbi:MAG TPA: asparagine synthase (glutamine-hydrolyzing) [Methylomirabilota bacterium]|nr:asparagine synthase (glutamine-hydrolyzing) [Methylomirabilota bacterium]